MSTSTISLRRSAALACLAIGLTACGDATGAGARKVGVSFNTAPRSGATLLRALRNVSGSAAGSLVITRAQLVLSETELARVGVVCSDSASGRDDCVDLELAPMLIDLPLDNSVRAALSVTLPAGTYSELEADIEAVTADEDDDPKYAAFLARHPDFRGVSVRVEGTYDGQPFVYTSDLEAEIELGFTPALVIDAVGGNVTVHVDLAAWFRDANGVTVDPRAANAGGTHHSIVRENIRRSFDAFEDDNRDGTDDAS